jgi:hypothetical protein
VTSRRGAMLLAPSHLEDIMNKVLVAGAALLLCTVSAALAEYPNFEINGFPITRHQMVAVSTGQIRESAPTPTLTVAGMPASPHQVAVLTPRIKLTQQQVTPKLTKVRF